jgi:hypothetical protein
MTQINRPIETQIEKFIPQGELATLSAIKLLTVSDNGRADTMVQVELAYLDSMLIASPWIKECAPITIATSIRYVLRNNLSFDPNAGLVYVTPRNAKQANGSSVRMMEVKPTANGLLSIAYQSGKVLDHKVPKVQKNAEGRVISVEFEVLKPTAGGTRWEVVEFDESDFNKWMKKSHVQNAMGKTDADLRKLNYANDNYTNFYGGIDPEFARAKAIKHGLKKLGINTSESMFAGKAPVSPVIDPQMARAEVTEEVTHEEVDAEASTTEAATIEAKDASTGSNTYVVTTVEEIDLFHTEEIDSQQHGRNGSEQTEAHTTPTPKKPKFDSSKL